MLAAIRMTVSLLKLRIGVAVAASAMAGIAAADGPAPGVGRSVVLALAVLGASGAAGAFNHYYERDLDRRMHRTRTRPFATGAFGDSLWWPASFSVLLVASLALAVAVAGMVSAAFVLLGAFTYGVVYTVWLKRRTAWNIVIGGASGSFAVLAGAAAVDPVPQALPLVLAVVLFLWTPPHFWSLAVAGAKDYARAGVPMLPVVAGLPETRRQIFIYSLLLAPLGAAPWLLGYTSLFYGAVAGTGGAIMVALAAAVKRADGTAGEAAAKRLFAFSVLYLFLVFAARLVDGWLPRFGNLM